MQKQLKFRNINGRYRIFGKGYPLILVHGFCDDEQVWESFVPYLGPDIQVIAPQLPGAGKGEYPSSLSLEKMAEFIREIISVEKLYKPVLIGHSMGAYVSLAFAEKYVDLLGGLGLFHSHPLADTEAAREARQKSIDFLKRHGTPPFVKEFIPNLFAPGFAEKEVTLIETLIERASKFNASGLIKHFEAMMTRPDRSQVLENCPCPVLFILGEDDPIIPRKVQLQQATLPSVASVHSLPGCGHMGMHELPDKASAVIRDFIQYITLYS